MITRDMKTGAIIAYLTDTFEPTSKDAAALIKVTYKDGRVVFGKPIADKREDANQSDAEEAS